MRRASTEMATSSRDARDGVELAEPRPQDAAAADEVWNSAVVRAAKVVFINVSKNASTSLKWLTAEISGQDPSNFYSIMGLAPGLRQSRWS